MKQLIGVILFLAAIAGALYLGVKYEINVSREAYNNGICSACGGKYQFSSAIHVKSGSDRYYYTCEDCGHTVMTYRIMK
jgi:DNA-directed RNA polymerase subunit RPC12/RpoP